MVSFSISRPDLIITREISAPSQASSEMWKIRNIAAASSVEAEMTASRRASSPELISESELTFSPVALTYLPRKNFTATAVPMMIRETAE